VSSELHNYYVGNILQTMYTNLLGIVPPSANGTLDTVIDMGYLADEMTIGELGSTIDGIFCYIYA
jgi:hypothetical protein